MNVNLEVFENIYKESSKEIEILNSQIDGDEIYRGTIFEGCTMEMPEQLTALLKINGLALGIINKHN